MNKTRFILPFIIFALIFALLWRGLSLHPNQIPSPLIGKPAPHFSLPTLENPKKLTTQNDFLEHVTFVNVWATWCSTCLAEHATLLQLAELEHVFLYGLDYKDDTNTAKKWLKEKGNPYQIIAVDANGTAAIDWGVYGTPETFVLDKKGIIRYKHTGAIDADSWEKTLKPLLEKLRNET